jgi:hypothetical protein
MTSPPDVATIARELQAMHQRAEVDGFVSVADAYRFAELTQAWDFYRETQPLNYQLYLDGLVYYIAECATGAA